jgi:hypothetical protein
MSLFGMESCGSAVSRPASAAPSTDKRWAVNPLTMPANMQSNHQQEQPNPPQRPPPPSPTACCRPKISVRSSTSRRTVPTHRSANTFACCARTGVRHPDAIGAEDRIETVGEPPILMADEEPELAHDNLRSAGLEPVETGQRARQQPIAKDRPESDPIALQPPVARLPRQRPLHLGAVARPSGRLPAPRAAHLTARPGRPTPGHEGAR